MADLVTPGEDGAGADARSAGHAWSKAGHDWIVDGVDIADAYASIDETTLDAFRHSTTNGLTVTIAAGEAYIAGWLVRDRTTDVTLPESSSTTIYVGYDAGAILPTDTAPSANENVIVGPASAFDPGDPRTPIYTFDTDTTTVTGSTDHRQLRKPIQYDPINDNVDVDADFTVRGSPVASESYVDNNRYTDIEARAAVTENLLGGTTVWVRHDAGGHPEGYRAGPEGLTNFSYHAGYSTVYSMHTGGGFKFRNAYAGTDGLDMFRVDNEQGDAWLRGDFSNEAVIDNSAGDGVVPALIQSGESLPSDTLTGRMVYDVSREQ